jgi:hypothetical protein
MFALFCLHRRQSRITAQQSLEVRLSSCPLSTSSIAMPYMQPYIYALSCNMLSDIYEPFPASNFFSSWPRDEQASTLEVWKAGLE